MLQDFEFSTYDLVIRTNWVLSKLIIYYNLQQVSGVWIGYYQLGLQYNEFSIALRYNYLLFQLKNKNNMYIYIYYTKANKSPSV
jgi:hypothetical protein